MRWDPRSIETLRGSPALLGSVLALSWSTSILVHPLKPILATIVNGERIGNALHRSRLSDLRTFSIRNVAGLLFVTRPGTDSGFHPPPHPPLSIFETRSGLTLYGSEVYSCWDAPLPCARRAMPDLRLRQADDMAHGFVCMESDSARVPPMEGCGF